MRITTLYPTGRYALFPFLLQYKNGYVLDIKMISTAKTVKKTPVYGTVDDSTGLKYYYRSSYPLNYRVVETFDSEKDAAAAGYMPTKALNQK